MLENPPHPVTLLRAPPAGNNLAVAVPATPLYRSGSLLVTIGISSGVRVGYLRSEILVVQSAQNWHRQRA